MMMAAGLLTATSCSDFDDYNTVPSDATASSQSTLWENISSNPELSDFAALVKKAGFDDELQSSTFYTVWAPLNGTYDATSLMAEDSATVLLQFVKHHIANYNYLATGTLDTRLRSLNQKSHTFTGAGSYLYSDVELQQSNLPSSNGTLHILNGQAGFYPNITEYLSQKKNLGDDISVDSICSYFNKYQLTYLDEKNSVVGPLVNGKQTYIDSVMTTSNVIMSNLGVKPAEEDSSYVWFIPTDKAWNDAFAKIKSAYKYAATTNAQKLSDGSTTITSTSTTIDAAFMQDSLTRYNIVRNQFFSANDVYNQWLVGGEKLYLDTIRSRRHNKFSDIEKTILPHVKQEVTFSNGVGKIVDSLAFYPWETYKPEIWESARSNKARVLNGSSSSQSVKIVYKDSEGNTTETQEFSYLHAKPSSNYAKPELDIYLPNVLATTYNIYCVMMPPSADDNDSTNWKPNQLDFKLSYANASGVVQSDKTLATKLENDPTKVDTMYVGKFTFPTCYSGLGSEIAPNIKITSPFSAFSKPMMAKYTRDLRIAAILLRPVEYDEYLATKE